MRQEEFKRRRKQLMKMVGKGGIAILPAAPEKQRNNDVLYHYRPDSDFYYLTGFEEPEAVAVLVPGRPQGHGRGRHGPHPAPFRRKTRFRNPVLQPSGRPIQRKSAARQARAAPARPRGPWGVMRNN